MATNEQVKGAKPAPPAAGASSAAAGVPNTFAAGNQIAGNPLAPLLNAQNAGALGGFNPFQGYNTNDPDLVSSSFKLQLETNTETATL